VPPHPQQQPRDVLEITKVEKLKKPPSTLGVGTTDNPARPTPKSRLIAGQKIRLLAFWEHRLGPELVAGGKTSPRTVEENCTTAHKRYQLH
jgi:hypothetical protein